MSDGSDGEATRSRLGDVWRIALPIVLVGLAFYPLESGDPIGPQRSLASRLEIWLFDSQAAPAGLVAVLAAWLAWRRFPALFRPDVPSTNTRGRAAAVGLATLALVLYTWARLNAAQDLLFLVLALGIAAVAADRHGARGVRALGLPIALLCVAIPVPSPLGNELLWTLQNWSASGAAGLLRLLGFDVLQSGALLTRGDFSFLVIEGCSGFRSLVTLTLVGVAVRELSGVEGLRGWLLVGGAIPLAIVLNFLRIALVVVGADFLEADVADTHLVQGLAVLAIGSTILFFVGHRLGPETLPPARARPSLASLREPLRRLTVGLAVLCVVGLVVSPWPPPSLSRAEEVAIPSRLQAWRSDPLQIDFPFIGLLPRDRIDRRHYRLEDGSPPEEGRIVELIAATGSMRLPRRSPVSSKLVVPGRQWQVERRERTYNWTLGHPIDVSIATTVGGRALVYSWSLHDDGPWRDSLRSLLALERGPMARPRPRLMIRLATQIGEEPEAESNARRMLDRFVFDFRDSLSRL